MAVTAGAGPALSKAYAGLSTDTKPSANVLDTFFETDTLRTYVYSGSAWVLVASSDTSGNTSVSLGTALAMERNVGTANAYGVGIGEWTAYIFNPRVASTGSAVGAAGTAGATEVLISSVPAMVGGFLFQGDSTAAKGIILRDTIATGNSVAGVYIAAGLVAPNAGATAPIYMPNGWKTTAGLTICGEAAGVSGVLLYRPV